MQWRPALRAWHRWFGLGAAAWLVMLSLTGCAIAYYDAFDTWLNPDLRRIDDTRLLQAHGIGIEQALRNARIALPGFEPRQVEMPQRAGGTLWMLGRAGDASVQLFADPRDGRVLGWRQSGRVAFDRRHVMDLLYGMHVDLLLGPWMTGVLGFVALLWLIDHAAAVLLAVPRGSRWREAFQVGGAPGSGRRRFDLHRAPAMWAFPVTLILAVTGVTLAWPDLSRDAVRSVVSVGERLDVELPDRSGGVPAIDADRAIEIGAAGARVHSLRLLPAKRAYAVRTFDERDVDDQGRLWTYVAMDDGRIVGRRHDTGGSVGDTFFVWQYALHSGRAFGLAGQTLVFLGGMATMAACVTGFLLWWRRRKR
jgi:uncharacterized iron-regulated membrane protein